MRKCVLLLGVAATALAVPAMAHDGQGYIGVDTGVFVFEEPEATVDTLLDPVRTDHEVGWELAALLGYDWGPVRTELEGSYREADTNEISSDAVGAANPPELTPYAGEHRLTSVMANLLVDVAGEADDPVGFSFGAGFGHTWMGVDTFDPFDAS